MKTKNTLLITNLKKGGNMSPAQSTYLLAKDLELARHLISANKTRPFWYERQLDTEAKDYRKIGNDNSSNNSQKPKI